MESPRPGGFKLREYWLHGPGAAKIGWGTSGDWRRCVVLLSEHMTTEQAKGYCNNLHRAATGMYPGDRRNR